MREIPTPTEKRSLNHSELNLKQSKRERKREITKKLEKPENDHRSLWNVQTVNRLKYKLPVTHLHTGAD